jgi:hypothetical protein
MSAAMRHPFLVVLSTWFAATASISSVVVPSTMLGGCVCTLEYIQGGLAIGFLLHPDQPGRFRVEIDMDGEPLSLLLERTAESVNCGDPCEARGKKWIMRLDGLPLPDLTFLITASNLAGDRGPARATVRVYQSDLLVHEEVLRPSYRTDEPSGSGCGIYENASAKITVEL